MAEFERELIRERVIRAGLDNARRKGKRIGRRPLPPADGEKIISLFQKDSSLSVRKIAKKVGMSTGFVGGVLKGAQDRQCKRLAIRWCLGGNSCCGAYVSAEHFKCPLKGDIRICLMIGFEHLEVFISVDKAYRSD
jgi:hypothetical protein